MRVTSTYRIFFASIVCMLFCQSSLFAGSPSALLFNQFQGIDSVLAAFARIVRPSKCDSAAITQALENLLEQHGGLSAVALADHRGNMIGFSGHEVRNEALSRKVSDREWYKTPRKTLQPFYGPLTEVDHRFYFLWGRPILTHSALGMTACEGVLVAYVNVAECFRNFSRAYRRPFEIGRDTTVFYHSDDWQTGLPFEEEPLHLQGGMDFTLRYTDSFSADSSAAATNASGAGSARAAAEVPKTLSRAADPSAGRFETESPARQSRGWLFFLAAGISGLAAGLVYVIRHRRKIEKIRKEEEERAKSIEEEKNAVRSDIKSALYQEVRSQIGKPELVRIEQEVKAGLRQEIEKTVLAKDSEELRRELKMEVKENVRAELVEETRRQLVTLESAALREEARAKLLDELSQRLRKEVGGQLEMEALQALTRTIHGEVRAEHAKPLKERALKDLEERTCREVAIRERSMLLANARASLKEAIEKEIREKEGTVLRSEAREAIMAAIRKELEDAASSGNPPAGSFDSPLPEGESARENVRLALADVRAAVRKTDESGALLSLVKTVDLLKSSQRDSQYFNLNAAQTSSMIEYLENISGRMQGYVADVKNGIGRLCRSIEPLLGEKRYREPGVVVPGNVPIEKEPPGMDALKIEEPGTLVESE